MPSASTSFIPLYQSLGASPGDSEGIRVAKVQLLESGLLGMMAALAFGLRRALQVEQLVGGRSFDDLDKYITPGELRALSDEYKRVAGFAPRARDF